MLKRFCRRVDIFIRRHRLRPISLAAKFRLQFGAAVLFSLVIGLLIPYFWMNQLVEKIALDSGRAIADTVFERHFKLSDEQGKGLPVLDESGLVKPVQNYTAQWIRFAETPDLSAVPLTDQQKKTVHKLLKHEDTYDYLWIDRESSGGAKSTYVRVVQASDSCITCHNPEGTGKAFNKNQKVGLLIVRAPAREFAWTILMNRLWVIIAGLFAAAGAMIAFYMITQRIIMRPIRQLRAIANNVTEGNLAARSALRSGDEFEKLSQAFNAMLDSLQESQEKLRQANIQLDAKIAQLSDRNIELFKANKLKSEFLANISHEFRTPLNAILGFAQLLYEKPVDNVEKSKRYAENIISSGRTLLNMINDLLDLAKAEAGKIELRIEKTSIAQLCEGLSAFFLPLVEQKNLELRVAVAEEVPLIQTDAGKVQQILYNFLSNAIKFTPDGGSINVDAKMRDEKTVRISVGDTGPGINEQDQQRIFEKFLQLDGSITRQGTGTGLGLAISKQLADLLACDISLESKPGQGCVFHLDIPVNPPQDKAAAPPAASS